MVARAATEKLRHAAQQRLNAMCTGYCMLEVMRGIEAYRKFRRLQYKQRRAAHIAPRHM
jgi:hypothetical protein